MKFESDLTEDRSDGQLQQAAFMRQFNDARCRRDSQIADAEAAATRLHGAGAEIAQEEALWEAMAAVRDAVVEAQPRSVADLAAKLDFYARSWAIDGQEDLLKQITHDVAGLSATATAFASPAPTQRAATSPALAALIAAVAVAQGKQDDHQRDVLDRPTFAGQDDATRHVQVQDNNALNDAWAQAENDVAAFPAATATDLHTKLSFMVEHHMGHGQDWLPEMLSDAARLAKMEG